MTIYCQGEVKEVEEDVNDQSIEVRDVPHLNELHLDKNQKDLPNKMSILKKVSPAAALRQNETSQWSINDTASGSLF
jgi:hypothetical protein